MSESGPDAPQGANGDGAGGGSRPERPPVRALDPATAMRLTDGRPPLPALYLSDRLLVRSAPGGGQPRGLDDLRTALARLDLDFRVTPRPDGTPRDLDQPTWGAVGYGGGVGDWGGWGYWGGVGGAALQEYSVPGRGGRMPVALALPDPRLRARPVDRRPVVVVPDTAIAAPPWFTDGEGLV